MKKVKFIWAGIFLLMSGMEVISMYYENFMNPVTTTIFVLLFSSLIPASYFLGQEYF